MAAGLTELHGEQSCVPRQQAPVEVLSKLTACGNAQNIRPICLIVLFIILLLVLRPCMEHSRISIRSLRACPTAYLCSGQCLARYAITETRPVYFVVPLYPLAFLQYTDDLLYIRPSRPYAGKPRQQASAASTVCVHSNSPLNLNEVQGSRNCDHLFLEVLLYAPM